MIYSTCFQRSLASVKISLKVFQHFQVEKVERIFNIIA